jgi:hypothetical protein
MPRQWWPGGTCFIHVVSSYRTRCDLGYEDTLYGIWDDMDMDEIPCRYDPAIFKSFKVLRPGVDYLFCIQVETSHYLAVYLGTVDTYLGT